MIDFNALLNVAFEQAIEAKVAPLRKQLEALDARQVMDIVELRDGEERLAPRLEYLVKSVAEDVLNEHKDEYDHDDFVTEGDIQDKVKDAFDSDFDSKVEAVIDGLRVTLNT